MSEIDDLIYGEPPSVVRWYHIRKLDSELKRSRQWNEAAQGALDALELNRLQLIDMRNEIRDGALRFCIERADRDAAAVTQRNRVAAILERARRIRDARGGEPGV